MSNSSLSLPLKDSIYRFPQGLQGSKYLIRDRDRIYGNMFREWIKDIGIQKILTSPKSPWQNGYSERVIGSIRKDCLDHVTVMNEQHLKRILKSYFEYCNPDRTHIDLGKDTPFDRAVQKTPKSGN